MNVYFPYQFSKDGRTALSADPKHIKDMIEQILFTNLGERVNRPNFGSGLLQSIFEPNSNEMAATLQFLIQGSLNQWLGTVIEVNEIELFQFDSTLEVKVTYTILINQDIQIVSFTKEM